MNKPVKTLQTETWTLPDEQFPMKIAYFVFHSDYTSVKIFGEDNEEGAEELFYFHSFPPFDFKEAPKWILDILIMCGVTYK